MTKPLLTPVTQHFALGAPTAEPVRVPGGLSNDLWRLTTHHGTYAVKRMVVNATRPGFVANVEASFQVELRAFRAGVPMPEPVPDPRTGRALAALDDGLYRVHRWIDGHPAAGHPSEAAALLARIHTAGHPRRAATPDTTWSGQRWHLAELTTPQPEHTLVVDSHRDLDRKNTLRTPQGRLIALDWDAAGPISAVHEAVALALDWSDADPAVFAETLQAYAEEAGHLPPAQPWIFGGWTAAHGGWLDHLAEHRPDDHAEIDGTLTRLRRLATTREDLLTALRQIQ